MIRERLKALGGTGGLIALDRKGNVAMPFSTAGMYRGYMKAGGELMCVSDAALAIQVKIKASRLGSSSSSVVNAMWDML